LLLDEPFASLDPNRRAQVRSDVVDLLRLTATPAVLVTHDQGEALATGDRVAVMRQGRLHQVGTPLEVYTHPVNRFVAGFMGEARFLPVRAEGGGLVSELGPLATAPAEATAPGAGSAPGEVVAVLRPADVAFEPDAAGAAVVARAEYRGETWIYELRLASGATVLSSRPRSVTAAVGDRVRAELTRGDGVALVPSEANGAARPSTP
jgi:iron(III) transport system ATP-binding protein